ITGTGGTSTNGGTTGVGGKFGSGGVQGSGGVHGRGYPSGSGHLLSRVSLEDSGVRGNRWERRRSRAMGLA
ncbi:MAG TPA: hypothetical protein VF550_12845, partial [Polyangia bacterium]